MSASDSIADHESDVFLVETCPLLGLSAPRSWPSSWTGNFGWSYSKQKQSSRPASQSLENSFQQPYCEDFNSSNEPTIPTSLIHNIVSDGKSEQVVTWFLNLIFQHKNDCGVGNLSNCSSDICCFAVQTWGSAEYPPGYWRTHGRMPSRKHRHGNCAFILLVISCGRGPCSCCSWNWFCLSSRFTMMNSLSMIPGGAKCRKLITENVFL